tara:strand:+ start:525 stop:1067 length:543 start_codon:yes stop_codon:yes gene_type:complete
MSTIKVSTISPLGTDATKTITIGSAGDTAAGLFTNVPAFEAYLSSDTTISNTTNTKVQPDTEVFDTDNCYDNSTNYRFTPTVAGKYFVYGTVSFSSSDFHVQQYIAYIYKNGSVYRRNNHYLETSKFSTVATGNVQAIIDMNGSTDYVELFCLTRYSSGTPNIESSTKSTYFGAYRIIGA